MHKSLHIHTKHTSNIYISLHVQILDEERSTNTKMAVTHKYVKRKYINLTIISPYQIYGTRN